MAPGDRSVDGKPVFHGEIEPVDNRRGDHGDRTSCRLAIEFAGASLAPPGRRLQGQEKTIGQIESVRRVFAEHHA